MMFARVRSLAMNIASARIYVDVLKSSSEMRAWSRARRRAGDTIAFVPTMGYLHEGHLSLVTGAKERADRVVTSIYVNPGQFAPHEDFDTYPRDAAGDHEKLLALGCDAVFEPSNLYGSAHQTWLRVEELERPLCGTSRPTFFRGVATVVCKLFNIVEPDIAVFGKKDFQQWRIIERMAEDLDFGVQIVGLPLIREPDGLAMSSRNARLSPEDRFAACSLSKALFEARDAVSNGTVNAESLREGIAQTLLTAGAQVDYIEIVDQITLKPVKKIDGPTVIALAAHVGDVRLIDNVEVHP